MKKLVILLVTMLTIGLALTSCSSSHSCSAYNTYDQYQIENMY